MNPDTEKIEFYQLRDMGRVISVATHLIRKHTGHLFRTVGLMTIPLLLASSTLYFLATSKTLDLAQNPESMGQTLPFLSFQYLFFILIAFVTYLTSVWATVYYMSLYEERGPENYDMSDIWSRVGKHGLMLIPAIIVYSIMLGLGAVLLSVIGGVLILIPFLGVLAIIGLFFGMLFVLSLYQMTITVLLVEKASIFNALGRAVTLLKGNWWKSVGVVFCSYIVVIAIAYVPTLGMTIYNVVSGLDAGGVPDPNRLRWIILVVQNIMLVLSFAGGILFHMSFTSLFYSLKEEKDRVSLTRRVQALAAADVPEE